MPDKQRTRKLPRSRPDRSNASRSALCRRETIVAKRHYIAMTFKEEANTKD